MSNAFQGNGAFHSREFRDSILRIVNNADSTKKIAFDASTIATGNTRTITMPDEDVTLGGGAKEELITTTEITSPVTTVDFTGLTTYKIYKCYLNQVQLGGIAKLGVNVRYLAGQNWETNNHRDHCHVIRNDADAPYSAKYYAHPYTWLTGDMSSVADRPINGYFYIYNMTESSKTMFEGRLTYNYGSQTEAVNNIAGVTNHWYATDGIRILTCGGSVQFESGFIDLYGIYPV